MNYFNMVATKVNALFSPIMSKIALGKAKSIAKNAIIHAEHAKVHVKINANLAVKTESAASFITESLV